MEVSAIDFIKKPALSLDKAQDEVVTIIKDGNVVAVLARPDHAPISHSLLGILKDAGVKNKDDIRDMKVGL